MTNASAELAAQRPNIIHSLVPTNAAEQKQAFLNGTVRNPTHHYAGLDRPYTDEVEQLIATGNVASGELDGCSLATEVACDETIESFVETTELMYFMKCYNEAATDSERQHYRREIMQLNAEMYGLPKLRDYRHVLATYMKKIDENSSQLHGKSREAHRELLAGFEKIAQVDDPGGYAPRQETIEWMQKVVETLYGGMLEHVEDDREYGPYELQALFRTIIYEEFGPELAAEWRVDVEPARVINVAPEQKRIVIPIDRSPVDSEKAKDLVVHEIGVHMLRSVNSYETDSALLGAGLAKHDGPEEGLGKVVEQARRGAFVEAGHALYLAASLAYIEGKDFRDTYEVMWRVLLLSSENPNDQSSIESAQDQAYNTCMRIFRGTDSVPWLKDTQYYNEAPDVWAYLDSICGDIDAFTTMMMGKTQITDSTQRNAVLEASST